MLRKIKKIHLQPTQILILGFLGLIFVGGVLLNLPIASRNNESIGFLDAIFTATSAVCVTGLVVRTTVEQWTLFGKAVILILIQIGGLGFMTIASTFFMLIGKKIGLRERMVIQEALNQSALSGMVRLTRNIIFGTLLIEGVGAILLSIRFVPAYGVYGIFMGVFHSVSAFCNAGFDIIGNSSLMPYVHDWHVNIVIMLLIILGGLGFTVWVDVVKITKEKIAKKLDFKHWFLKLTLHTKLVLVINLILFGGAFILFFLFEMNNPLTMGEFTFGEKILASLFQGVTPRTAGFNTIDLAAMTDASKFLTILLMFVGGSPAGTAGGVKTVTIAVLMFAVLSVIKGKEDTEAFHKRIPRDIVKRALSVVSISIFVIITLTIILTIVETQDFMDILFEAVSGFATVGLTLGITSQLSVIGKILLCITMFIGRLGPMTMAFAMAIRSDKGKTGIKQPEEKVMVG